jgi:hypothetical protein
MDAMAAGNANCEPSGGCTKPSGFGVGNEYCQSATQNTYPIDANKQAFMTIAEEQRLIVRKERIPESMVPS